MSAITKVNINDPAETSKSATETINNGAAAKGATNAEGQLPEWLKAELFADLLQQNVPNFKRITNFIAEIWEGAGENYGNVLASVNLDAELEDGKIQNFSYVIKLPIDSVQEFMANYHNIIDTENAIYKDVIPEIEQMYRDAGVDLKFGTKYYDLKTPSEFGVVLMEDLRPHGFKNVNRLEGFDMDHTKAALKKLAQWHAASAVRVETKGPYSKIVSDGVYNEDMLKIMDQIGESTTALYMECVRTYKDHEEYYDSLKRNQENFADEFRPLLKIDPNEFNVLNHGDFWANNVMFQYDDAGKVKETYFIDFQLTRYGPPINDLYTLLLSSTSLDVKLKHFDYFIKYYHDNLIEYLTLLKYPKKLPTLKEIHIAMLKYGTFAVNTVIGHLSIVLLEPNETASIANIFGDSEDSIALKKAMYTNSRYRKHIEALFPWLYHRGAF
uniref:CHK kinase-like domain-containing protein n=1 Tax=Bactrocera latifrons TaxID=174628 RepID=A0A0K8UGZ9_BACLA